jgi:hypothetical protein
MPCVNHFVDAVPKKRGPKTDVLEALVKRIDGLEKKLKDEKKSNSPAEDSHNTNTEKQNAPQDPKLQLDTAIAADESAVYSPTPVRLVKCISGKPHKLIWLAHSEPSPAVQQDLLLDTYFQRCHGNPYYILDEPSTRHKIQSSHIPSFLLQAIYAVSARWVDCFQVEIVD